MNHFLLGVFFSEANLWKKMEQGAELLRQTLKLHVRGRGHKNSNNCNTVQQK